MRLDRSTRPALLLLSTLTLFSAQTLLHGDGDRPEPGAVEKSDLLPAAGPKPLSEQVRKGLDWLVNHQLENGGFGQGETSALIRGGEPQAGQANVADTCIAMSAFLRSGSTPTSGPYADNLSRALDYVLTEIEKADRDSLSITSVNGTRVQGKLGPHIDTFLASVVLTGIDGRVSGAEAKERLGSCVAKVLRKIEINQQQDGGWGAGGWAPVLGEALASKGLNSALRNDSIDSSDASVRAMEEARQAVAGAGGGFENDGAAGVALYAGSANLGKLQDSVLTFKKKEKELKDQAANAPSPEARKRALDLIDEFEKSEDALEVMQQSMVGRLQDDAFVAGFGSNGGEEFLSYMNIGESLYRSGGNDWTRWDGKMTDNLNRIQNKDGSWTGHHCITGKTFCTASALLVLMTDRVPTN